MNEDQIRLRLTVTVTKGGKRFSRSSVVERMDDGPKTDVRLRNWVSSESDEIISAARKAVPS